jgi:F-type H+-transporting ATPase subunit epsilon
MVVAKTLEGDIGILASHPPVLGILAAGSVVRVFDPDADASEGAGSGAAGGEGGELTAAVSGGFFSVAGDRVSILCRAAELGRDVDARAARAELESASDAEEPAEAEYARARLRAAGEQA